MTEASKQVVKRFNKEVIEQGNAASFQELMDAAFINHSAPVGMNNGPEGMRYFFEEILRPAMPGLQVTIHAQVAEGDLVTTRKTIAGTQSGPFLGIAPTHKQITIDVIDVVRVRDGKYVEHWGLTTLPTVLAELSRQ